MSKKFFSSKTLFILPLISVIGIILLNVLLKQFRQHYIFDVDNYWPISIFLPVVPVWSDVLILSGIILVWVGFIKFWQRGISIYKLLPIMGLLTMGTNLFEGFERGWAYPMNGGDSVISDFYWRDVDKMSGVLSLLKSYTDIQPWLELHSSNHPPGPMILIYILRSILNHNPYLVSIIIMCLGILSSIVIYKFLRTELDERMSKLGAILLVLLPATQVYFLATIDAVILTAFIATFWTWQHNRQMLWLLITSVFLWISSLLTFGVLFLVPILMFDDWRRNSSIMLSFKLFGLMGLIYVFLFFTTGFNYLLSFKLAIMKEAFGGFYGFLNPLSYSITRIEDILEILIFLGPFLTYLLFKSLKKINLISDFGKPKIIPVVAIASLLLFFLSGAYYTGETARNAMYIYPFLIISIVFYLEKIGVKKNEGTLLLHLVFGQSVLMQLVGYYVW